MKLPTGALFSSPRSAQRVVDIPGPGSWDLYGGQNKLAKNFIKSPWAFACMDIRGSELAGLPWGLVDRNGTEVKSHALIDMLTEFGMESNFFEALRATEIDLLLGSQLGGVAYWFRDVDQLVRLDPEMIRIKQDRTGIQGFEQFLNGRKVGTFERDQIVYFREYNPDNQLLPGPSVYQAVWRAICIEYEAGLYAEAFFKNDATPSILLSTESDIQQNDLEKLRDWFNRTFSGARQAHKTGFLSKGFKAQILSTSMKDIALTEIRTRAQNDICAGFRVPSILVANMVDATYANANEARKFCLEDVVIPRSKFVAGVINADLIHKVDANVSLRFYPDRLPILQEAEWGKLKEGVQGNIITAEFARSRMGWPDTAAPDEAPIPVTDTVFEPTARAWAKKSTKALKAGRSANVDFETDQIAPERQQAIRSRLAAATTPADVQNAFRTENEEMNLKDTLELIKAMQPAGPALSLSLPGAVVHANDPEAIAAAVRTAVAAMPAPAVTVEAPTVHVAPPEVHVTTPEVVVNMPKAPKIRGTVEHQNVERTVAGELKATNKTTAFQYEDEP